MTYYKDSDRIQDAIIPALFRGYLWFLIEESPDIEEDLRPKVDIFNAEINKAFKGADKSKLNRRLNRVCHKVNDYIKREKFDSRKCFLAIFGWASAVYDAGGVIIKGDYWEIMLGLKEIVDEGYEKIQDFEKIDGSALKHVEKIHRIIQNEGYF